MGWKRENEKGRGAPRKEIKGGKPLLVLFPAVFTKCDTLFFFYIREGQSSAREEED